MDISTWIDTIIPLIAVIVCGTIAVIIAHYELQIRESESLRQIIGIISFPFRLLGEVELAILVVLFMMVFLPFCLLRAIILSFKGTYSKGWLTFLDRLRDSLESLTKDGLFIASEWFEYLKWITLIGTISVVGAETKNQLIQIMANLSYVMMFFIVYSDIKKLFSFLFFEKTFGDLIKTIVEKDMVKGIGVEGMTAMKSLRLLFYGLALIPSIAITFLISKFIYYLVPIIQKTLLQH